MTFIDDIINSVKNVASSVVNKLSDVAITVSNKLGQVSTTIVTGVEDFFKEAVNNINEFFSIFTSFFNLFPKLLNLSIKILKFLASELPKFGLMIYNEIKELVPLAIEFIFLIINKILKYKKYFMAMLFLSPAYFIVNFILNFISILD